MAQNQQISNQIKTDNPLALSIQKKLDKVPYQSTTTKNEINIFRVPAHIRETKKNFYEPRVVSIGPYHRGREDIKCMESEKLRYLGKMLHVNPDVNLENYLEELKKLEARAQRCYYESIDMDSNEFVEMLLYDACFIIQVIVNWTFPESDILSSINWNIPLIKGDLLMLENQIPFFVLQHVFDLFLGRDDDNSTTGGTEFDEASLSEDGVSEKATLFYCLVEFLQYGSETLSVPEGHNTYDHLLDFYYECYMHTHGLFPVRPNKKFLIPFEILGSKIKVSPPILKILRVHRRQPVILNRKHQMIPCATDLQEEARRPRLMNLIAFEQCNGEKYKPLTSYAVFMDCIINRSRDMKILEQNGIIENKLANKMAATEFFKELVQCCYPDYDNHHLAELFQKVNDYCDSPWRKHRAKLIRDYFSNPWSIISLSAAVVLLLLTFLQTLYSVMVYYR